MIAYYSELYVSLLLFTTNCIVCLNIIVMQFSSLAIFAFMAITMCTLSFWKIIKYFPSQALYTSLSSICDDNLLFCACSIGTFLFVLLHISIPTFFALS